MSGGVDSSAAALLLLRAGYDVTGVTMRLCPDRLARQSGADASCPPDDIGDARRVARALGIDHIVLNFQDVFETNVIDYFAEQYAAGITPNPCIACNRHLKFGAMLRRARELGFDWIATGHYAVIEQNAAGRRLLKRAPTGKDQSYVLYSLTQEQLGRTLLPLGRLTKPQVRALAQEAGLPVAHKPDSQEICFVENNDYAGFIERYTGTAAPEGNFVDESGRVLGRHRGITHYTVGQRKGLGVSFGKPMYVTKIDAAHNTVTLGEEGSQYADSLIAADLNFIPFDALEAPVRAQVKARYQAQPAPALLVPLENGTLRVEFDRPQRAVTPGQAAVFYDGDLVLGGGTIQAR